METHIAGHLCSGGFNLKLALLQSPFLSLQDGRVMHACRPQLHSAPSLAPPPARPTHQSSHIIIPVISMH